MIALSSLAISHLPNIFGCPSCEDGSCYVGLGLKAMTEKTFELVIFLLRIQAQKNSKMFIWHF